MSDADLFNEWLNRTMPEFRKAIPDGSFTAHYDEQEHVYDVSVHTPKHGDIVLTVTRSAIYFNVSRAFAMVGRNPETHEPILKPIVGANHMPIPEILRVARNLQDTWQDQ